MDNMKKIVTRNIIL